MNMRRLIALWLMSLNLCQGQNQLVVLSPSMFEHHQQIRLADLDGWIFRPGHDPRWASDSTDGEGWKAFKPTELTAKMEDSNGRVEGWFKLRFKLDSTFAGIPLGLSRNLWAASDIYLDGQLVRSFGNTGNPYQAYNPTLQPATPVPFIPGREHVLAMHVVDYETLLTHRELRLKPKHLKNLLQLTGPEYNAFVLDKIRDSNIFNTLWMSAAALLAFLFWLLVYLNPRQLIFKYIAVLSTVVILEIFVNICQTIFDLSYTAEKIRFIGAGVLGPILTTFTLIVAERVLKGKTTWISILILLLLTPASVIAHLFDISVPFGIINSCMLIYFAWLVFRSWSTISPSQWAVITGMALPTLGAVVYVSLHKYSIALFHEYENLLFTIIALGAPFLLLVYISIRFKEILIEKEHEAQTVIRITEEKKTLLTRQNEMLEQQVAERTAALKASLEELKTAQNQLIQSEKMASLGELTAGIAHEIQNPLNFVNNFSEVNAELIQELEQALEKGNPDEANLIMKDIRENEEKIIHHGKRADAIVKGMLQHCRSSNGQKEVTDLNELCDEYLRLAYHGIRAKDKSFNAQMHTDFDKSLEKLPLIAQDIGRVLLNLLTNAFYAVAEKKKTAGEGYEPTVWVTTRSSGPNVEIEVRDNGQGIPKKLLDKIFQPFFTTKPTGQGTGLGLSLSYDIVKAHGGKLTVDTVEGEGTTFLILLPKSDSI